MPVMVPIIMPKNTETDVNWTVNLAPCSSTGREDQTRSQRNSKVNPPFPEKGWATYSHTPPRGIPLLCAEPFFINSVVSSVLMQLGQGTIDLLQKRLVLFIDGDAVKLIFRDGPHVSKGGAWGGLPQDKPQPRADQPRPHQRHR